jgi:diguanylate cyclase (GGDEF)-like protein/PAS domain S-box-containing protein
MFYLLSRPRCVVQDVSLLRCRNDQAIISSSALLGAVPPQTDRIRQKRKEGAGARLRVPSHVCSEIADPSLGSLDNRTILVQDNTHGCNVPARRLISTDSKPTRTQAPIGTVQVANLNDWHEPISASILAADAEKAAMILEYDIRRAWAERRFALAYQPQLNLFNNRVIAFEALLRWSDPARGHVPPSTIIPIAEAAGLIDDLGQWVLDTACLEAAHWPENIRVAVNVSTLQLQNRALPSIVAAALRSSGLAPSRLELEITESSVMPADTACLTILREIRDTGVRVVIDDFDVGYSALGYLLKFPFDKIKIDRSFTARLGRAEHRHDAAEAICRAIVGLCKDLNMTVLAEGVETREQLMVLRGSHCTEVQGYLSGHPLPASAVKDTLIAAPALMRQMTGGGAFDAVAAHDLWLEGVPFSQIAESLNDIVIVTTPDLDSPGPSIVYVNPAFTRLTGYTAVEAIGQSPRLLQGPGTSRTTLDKIAAGLRAGKSVHEKVLNFGKSGAPYWLDIKISPLRDAAGMITHFAAIERDVTLDKRRLDELEHLADRDTLTGIPNRRAFLRAVNAEIEAAVQRGTTAVGQGPCLVFMDLDHFKRVNDDWGHKVGDSVLCSIADCLVENVRRVDILGRIGGDEFAVCMPTVTLQEAKALASRLRHAVASAPLATPAGPLNITVSIGVACFEPGENADAVIARADVAMYAAKRAGGDCVSETSVVPAQINQLPRL